MSIGIIKFIIDIVRELNIKVRFGAFRFANYMFTRLRSKKLAQYLIPKMEKLFHMSETIQDLYQKLCRLDFPITLCIYQLLNHISDQEEITNQTVKNKILVKQYIGVKRIRNIEKIEFF